MDADAVRESLKQLQVVESGVVIIHAAASGADASRGCIAGTLGLHVDVDLVDWVTITQLATTGSEVLRPHNLETCDH